MADVPTSKIERYGSDYLSPQERAEFEKKRLEALDSVSPTQDTAEVINSLDDNAFSVRLSKHLSDYKRGEGYLSGAVSNELYDRSGSIANTLSQIDPKAATAYAAYSTGFGYSGRARFIQGLSGAAQAESTLHDLVKASLKKI